MPLLQYFFGVGGALLCLLFVFDAYVPKEPPREQHELDKSTIRISAPRTGDYVIDHFPAVRNDLAVDPAEAVRRALAMMPESDRKSADVPAARRESPASPRKRRVAQRQQPRLPRGEAPSPERPQTLASNGWSSNNSWPQNSWQNSWPNFGNRSSNGSSHGWSTNWNNNYSQSGSNNR